MLTIKIGLTSPSSSGWGGVLMKPTPTPLFDPYSPRFAPPYPLLYPIPLRYTPIPYNSRIGPGYYPEAFLLLASSPLSASSC